MQPIDSTRVDSLTNQNLVDKIDLKALIRPHLENADKNKNILEKKVEYEKAFTILLSNIGNVSSQNLEQELFRLVEQYAKNTLYAQGDNGFEESAHLLELSFRMQLQQLSLNDFNFDWSKMESLKKLIEESAKLPSLKQQDIKIVTSVLSERLQGKEDLKEILKNTLIRMTFSHQNIKDYREYDFLKKWHEVTESVIGSETAKEQADLADYRYNRVDLLESLLAEKEGREYSIQDKNQSYELVLTPVKAFYGEAHPTFISLSSQVENKRGLNFIFGASDMKDTKACQNAYGHFKEGFRLRVLALDGYKKLYNEETDPDKKIELDKKLFDQELLLANLMTGFVHSITNKGDVTEQDLNDIKSMAESLKKYKTSLDSSNNKHIYSDGYTKAYEKAVDFLKSKGVILVDPEVTEKN